jgi:preprotein translocase subunit SecG
MWVMTAYFVLGVIMNGISRSKPERLIMTPTTAALAALYLVLALH